MDSFNFLIKINKIENHVYAWSKECCEWQKFVCKQQSNWIILPGIHLKKAWNMQPIWIIMLDEIKQNPLFINSGFCKGIKKIIV